MKLFFSLSLMLSTIITSYACTLWGCIGTSVQSNGILISKNRDMIDKTPWTMKTVNPKQGNYKFLAMLADKNDNYTVRGGINEAGLVVFNADAPPYTQAIAIEQHNVLYSILATCQSIDEVLSHSKIYFLGKAFLLLADKNELAYIEIIGDNQYHIKRIKNGNLYHTNHYLDTGYMQYNTEASHSSMIRCNRIAQLLQSKPFFTLNDCIAFSKDKNADKNNSICRDGDDTHHGRTLGNMSIYIPFAANTAPQVYMNIRQKGEKMFKENTIILTPKFWKKGFSIE